MAPMGTRQVCVAQTSIHIKYILKSCKRVGTMAQQVKGFAIKPDNLGSIFRTFIMDGRTNFLTSTKHLNVHVHTKKVNYF